MGSTTADEAAAEARSTDRTADSDQDRTEGTAHKTGQEPAVLQETAVSDKGTEPASDDTGSGEDTDTDATHADAADDAASAEAKEPSGVGQGAGAVVAAGLGVVSLSGSWIGTVAAARESLIGQLETSQSAGVAQQIQAVYGDQWKVTALIGGVFALAALIIGSVVLARPAFGEPGRPQAPWIKSVAWSGVSLGVIGLLLAVLKYSDALLGLPSVGS